MDFRLLAAICGVCLVLVSCGNKEEFNGDVAKGILESNAVNLDGEQVTITGMQLDCGVQSDLWDAPAQVSQGRSTARLSAQGRQLNFSDDPAIDADFRQPYVQVRGAFSLEVGDVQDVRDGEAAGTKLVAAKAGVKVQNPCFANALPIMGVKKGAFREDAPVAFLFRQKEDGWHLEKLVH
jgi:hypothetical protein